MLSRQNTLAYPATLASRESSPQLTQPLDSEPCLVRSPTLTKRAIEGQMQKAPLGTQVLPTTVQRRNLPDFIKHREPAAVSAKRAKSLSSQGDSSLNSEDSDDADRPINRDRLLYMRERLESYNDPDYKKYGPANDFKDVTPTTSQGSDVRLSQTSLFNEDHDDEAFCYEDVINYIMGCLTLKEIQDTLISVFYVNWDEQRGCDDVYELLFFELNTSPHGMQYLIEACLRKVVPGIVPSGGVLHTAAGPAPPQAP
jgi:hypothetical protein